MESDSLADLLENIDSAVEFNEASPVEITVASTIIGAPEVKFDRLQIYAMLELVRSERKGREP